jgi:CubicO group peptidase (beta-lactamase class C family)
MSLKRCFTFALVFLVATITYAQKPKSVEDAIKRAHFLAEQTLIKNKLPGLSIAVSMNGKLLWKEGFGYANIEEKINVDPDQHLFRIGSISKPITATALGQLVESGKIKFNDPIQKHVSYFPEKKFPINIEQVAGHLGGIRHYQGFEFYSNKYYEDVESAIGVFKDDSLRFQPGNKYAYSSYGWNLLSAVVEGASGEAFIPYMYEHVFRPLEMNNTHPDDKAKNIQGITNFYNNKEGKLIEAGEVDLSIKYAGGGFLSTASDLIKFAESYNKRTLLNAKTIKKMWEPMKLNNGKLSRYGIGWRQGQDKKGRHWVGHTGGSVGGSSAMFLFEDQDLIVIILCNQSQANFSELPFKIANQFFYEN